MAIPQALARAPWPVGLPMPVTAEPASGGWVADVWLAVLADGSEAAVKLTPFDAEAEVDGLAALRGAGVPVPGVLGHVAGTLVLQRVGGPAGWQAVGRAVARMHLVTHDRYGWHRDNRAGRFEQSNAWADDWPAFFVDRRVAIHLADPAVPAGFRRRLERACSGPIQELLPRLPRASLTHGDLWRGNVVAGSWVVDPEVSFADRELDLANMQMSRTDPFPREFWSGYFELLDLPEGFLQRRTVLQLHHLLLQVRHFGARCLPDLDAALAVHGW